MLTSILQNDALFKMESHTLLSIGLESHTLLSMP